MHAHSSLILVKWSIDDTRRVRICKSPMSSMQVPISKQIARGETRSAMKVESSIHYRGIDSRTSWRALADEHVEDQYFRSGTAHQGLVSAALWMCRHGLTIFIETFALLVEPPRLQRHLARSRWVTPVYIRPKRSPLKDYTETQSHRTICDGSTRLYTMLFTDSPRGCRRIRP